MTMYGNSHLTDPINKIDEIRNSCNNKKVMNDQQQQQKQEQEQKQNDVKKETAEPNIGNNHSSSKNKPLRMTSADDYIMLEEGYTPDDTDVICSWARQNVS